MLCRAHLREVDPPPPQTLPLTSRSLSIPAPAHHSGRKGPVQLQTPLTVAPPSVPHQPPPVQPPSPLHSPHAPSIKLKLASLSRSYLLTDNRSPVV